LKEPIKVAKKVGVEKLVMGCMGQGLTFVKISNYSLLALKIKIKTSITS
jgi:hypothetical protein